MTHSFACVAIGGTKCTVALASSEDDEVRWLGRREGPTHGGGEVMVEELSTLLAGMLSHTDSRVTRIGVVCGGPLDERKGLVLSPPNLPGWDDFDILTPFEERFAAPARLMNDASAGVLAEWAWGAARDSETSVFLTMGTGMGAGLIVSGRFHGGVSGLAGEVGHWRLAPDGPWGFGKFGSFEGFCSGGGIALWAQERARAALADGRGTSLATTEADIAEITARQAGDAARSGDAVALELWRDVGDRLGSTMALFVDLLNPEVIVIGGIFPRQEELLRPSLDAALRREALATSLAACQVRPALLGELISDYSALAVAVVGESFDDTSRRLSEAVQRP